MNGQWFGASFGQWWGGAEVTPTNPGVPTAIGSAGHFPPSRPRSGEGKRSRDDKDILEILVLIAGAI